ncbi:MAG: YraN family protein [Defluviitaleaceae bacterium]|nr:YraN family protein [Defluviitaleaceae bacterium]
MSVNKVAAGLRGQNEAEKFLIARGIEILQRNYRVRFGEIDLICREGGVIIFAEVKFRSGTGFGSPAESVGYAKQQKIIRTAMHYIAANNLDDNDFRFDVIEVLEVLEKRNVVHVNQIENAFGV